MNCDRAIDLVVDDLMDGLDTEEATALHEHLAACPECATEAEGMRTLWQDMSDVPAPAPGGETFIRFGRRMERTQRRRTWPIPLRIAAALVLLLGGGLVGRLSVDASSGSTVPGPLQPTGQLYLLAIRGNEPDRRFTEGQLLGEYRDWAIDLANQGRLILAQKLADDGGRWVDDLAPPGQDQASLALRGYFLVRADSYEDAVAVARQSPHIAYGGTIEVRRIQEE